MMRLKNTTILTNKRGQKQIRRKKRPMNSKTGQLNSSNCSSKKKKEQKRAKIV